MIRPGVKKLFRLAFHRREDAARDVSEEMRLHIELRTEQLIGGGLAPDRAREEAQRRFGSTDDMRRTMEETAAHREVVMRKREWIEAFTQDLRYVLRSLKRSPTFVVSATLTLALGLGANAALFSILDRLYLQAPAGVTSPKQVQRLYRGYTNAQRKRQVLSVLSPPEWLAIADGLPSGASLAGYNTEAKIRLGKDESAPEGVVTYVLGDYFGTLGTPIVAGRNFTDEEIRAEGLSPVAIVSSALALDRYGSEREALNRPFDVGLHRYTIIGVAPPAFRGTDLDASDVWVPMNTNGAWVNRDVYWYQEKGSLFIHTIVRTASVAARPALTASATAALKRVSVFTDTTSTVVSFGSINEMLAPGFDESESAIATRLATVAFAILLIACANVANLLLVRALQRRREIGVRLALGVSRGRLVAQLLTESVVLAAASGVAALAVAAWTATALRHALLPSVQWGAPAIGWRVVLFALLTAVIVGLAAGLAPALHASRPNLTNVLKGGVRDGAAHRSTVRAGLLVSQLALSCVLLAGAGLFIRSLQHVEAVDIGYDQDRIVFAGVRLSQESGRKPEESGALLTDAASRIEKLPGVERVAFTLNTPMWSFSFVSAFLSSGDTLPRNGEGPIASFVSSGFFASMGMRMLEGRDLTPEDREGSEPVLIVNSMFANTVWPGESAVGKCLILHKREEGCRRVVGVVSNAHFIRVIEQPTMQFYVPLAQDGGSSKAGFPGAIEIRTSPGRAAAVAAQVQKLLIGMSGSGMRPFTRTLSDQLAPQLRNWRLGAALFSAAGLLALLVAGVGIYGSIAYTFSQRTHEIGVRIALGAPGTNIIALVLKSSVMLSAIGVVIGTGIAIWAGRFVKPLLYGTSPNNPFVLGGVGLVLLAVAVLASLVPAIRAKRVDPIEALRAE